MIKTLNSANAPLSEEQKQAIVNTPEFMEKFAAEMDKVVVAVSVDDDLQLTDCIMSCLSNIPYNNVNIDVEGYQKITTEKFSNLPNGLKMKALQIILGSSPKNMRSADSFGNIAIAAKLFTNIMTQSDEIRDRLVSQIDTARKLGI